MTAKAAAANGPAATVADLTVGKAPPPEVRAKDPSDGPVDDDLALIEESVPQVDESVIRTCLLALGGGLGFTLGDDDVSDHWRFSERELADLVPPLTRIVNRNAKLRRAVIRGDEIAVAVAFGGYVGRNMAEGNKARKERRERDREVEAPQGDAGADGQGLAGRGGLWGSRPGDGRVDDGPAGGGVG